MKEISVSEQLDIEHKRNIDYIAGRISALDEQIYDLKTSFLNEDLKEAYEHQVRSLALLERIPLEPELTLLIAGILREQI